MTKIERTDRTWNPVTSGDRTSPGCDTHTSGPEIGVTLDLVALAEPLRWRKPQRVDVNSRFDLFHPAVPDQLIAEVFTTMARAPKHTFQVLTKRPQRMAHLMNRVAWRTPATAERRQGDHGVLAYLWDDGDANQDHCGGPSVRPNVWLGTSLETDRYTFRADHLRATPAAIRFLSLEPLLGPVPSLDLTGIDWVIVGGESRPGARPMHLDWVRDIRDRCQAGGVAFFFNQTGSVFARTEELASQAGRDFGELPADLRLREFPRGA